MATRSEENRATTERDSAKAKAKAAKAKAQPEETAPNGGAAKRATYAREAPRTGRPSRKSSRKSANRAKPDAAQVSVHELERNAPETRFRASRAKGKRVRGSATR